MTRLDATATLVLSASLFGALSSCTSSHSRARDGDVNDVSVVFDSRDAGSSTDVARELAAIDSPVDLVSSTDIGPDRSTSIDVANDRRDDGRQERDAMLDGQGALDVARDLALPDARSGDTSSPAERPQDAPILADASSDAGPAALRIAIPLYVWPGEGTDWATVAAAWRAVSYVIANAGDPGGPGPSADSSYTSAIAGAHKAGQRVLGYVDTNYAGRSLATVAAEIDQWYSFYPDIDGIFLDLSPDSPARIADYYKPLSDRIRAKSGPHVVVINPGQPNFDQGYMAVADIAMTYENPYASAVGYAPGVYSAPAWMAGYAAERFWHVILEVADVTAMKKVLDLARSRNVGHVFITNYPDPPAYARLPTYFADEVAAVP